MKVEVNTDEYDCFNESEIVCPFCGYRDLDSWEVNLTESGEEIECGNCGRTFSASAEVTTTYTTSPIEFGLVGCNQETWEIGDCFEDGCETQADEDWCNKQFECAIEKVNEAQI